VKSIIERDIKAEYAGISERLRSSEGMKLAILQHDISEIQKDIGRIDDILNIVEDFTRGELQNDAIAFLLRFRDLNENIEFALTKPFKVMIDVYPNDLPRELAERRVMLERMEQQKHVVKLKDDIIWQMIQDKKKDSNRQIADLDKDTQQEMNEWAKLTDKFAYELMKYQLVCTYCGVHLDESTVNTRCDKNSEERKEEGEEVKNKYCIDEAPLEHRGNSNHYFSKPHPSYFQNPLKSPISLQIQQVAHEDPRIAAALNKIKTTGRNKNINFEEEFKIMDRLSNGEIYKEDFAQFLRKSIMLEPELIEIFLNAISPPPKRQVNYKLFLTLIEEFEDKSGQNYPPLFSAYNTFQEKSRSQGKQGMYGMQNMQQKFTSNPYNPLADSVGEYGGIAGVNRDKNKTNLYPHNAYDQSVKFK
jgi:hypothetical protein